MLLSLSGEVLMWSFFCCFDIASKVLLNFDTRFTVIANNFVFRRIDGSLIELVSSSVLSHANVSIFVFCSVIIRVTTQTGYKLESGSSYWQIQGISVTRGFAITFSPAKSFPRRKSIPSRVQQLVYSHDWMRYKPGQRELMDNS